MSNKYVYPYEAIGTVICDHIETVRNNHQKTVSAKSNHQHLWQKIIRDALHSKLEGTKHSGKKIFDVFYSGETALGMMTKESPLSFFINYNPMLPRETVVDVIQKLKFDLRIKHDISSVSDIIKNYIESLILSHATHDQAKASGQKDRSAITVIPDKRDNIVSFLVKNIPVVPPGEQEDEEELSTESSVEYFEVEGETVARGGFEGRNTNTKRGSMAARRTDLRIVLPTPLGEVVHSDTQTLMQAIGDSPFLSDVLFGVILWASAQKFYLDNESFAKLVRTKSETVHREPEARDLSMRAFGLMSLASLVIAAVQNPTLVQVEGTTPNGQPLDDPNLDSEKAKVGRYFIALVRLLASPERFTLGTNPDSTVAENKFQIYIPTIENATMKYKLSAATLIGDHDDCRKQYHFARDVASTTDAFLGYPLSSQSAEVQKRFAKKGDQGAVNEEIESWIQAVLFGVLRTDDKGGFIDPLREVRYCKRCVHCGTRDIRVDADKIDICIDCKYSKQKEIEAQRAHRNSWAGVATAAANTGTNGTSASTRGNNVGSRGRGRGGTVPPVQIEPTPPAPRGRGRGRGGVIIETPPDPQRSDPDINYDGVCFGCGKERCYLKNESIKVLCANCR